MEQLLLKGLLLLLWFAVIVFDPLTKIKDNLDLLHWNVIVHYIFWFIGLCQRLRSSAESAIS